MNRAKTTFNFIAVLFIIFGCFVAGTHAQGVEPAPKLPAGMKGSNPNDPRTKLTAGVYDAGEAAFGIKHISLLKKPTAFDIGVDPNSPMVGKALKALGIPPDAPIPPATKMSFAPLAFANSDIAFQGNKLFLGNFYGFNIYDISNPSSSKLLTSVVCPGGQGDLSVYGNLLFMSVEMPNGRLDCSADGFDPGDPNKLPVASKDRFRGVRIFDISDISSPKQVAAVQSCRGSHTHTLVPDPKDKDNVYVYISGTSFVRQGEELTGCTDGTPDKNPETARFRIDVIKVPLAAPQNAKIIASPRIFSDETGKANALNDGGSHGNISKEGVQRVEDTDQCHDITVYSELGLAAGACAGNGILLDIKDPANPKRIDSVNDKNYAYWHSASFSNDGKKVVFTDEWGGGMGARCRENDPNVWGANAIFALNNDKLKFGNYYKLPAAQGDSENCVAHNGSLVPVPGRDLKVQAWYQGGISIMDFTDSANPFEVAYFDRGAIDPKTLILAGSWSAYWYNGSIYSSEIARGLDIFELTPTKFLTQNEIDAAKTVQVAQLNVQSQQKNVWSNKLIIAKAFLDQLERSQTLSADKLAKMRDAIQTAETSNKLGKLKGYAKSLEKDAKKSKKADDTARLNALAAVLKQPEM
jgi:LVIVD repeat